MESFWLEPGVDKEVGIDLGLLLAEALYRQGIGVVFGILLAGARIDNGVEIVLGILLAEAWYRQRSRYCSWNPIGWSLAKATK